MKELPRPYHTGQRNIPATSLNQVLDATKRMIQGGNGINVRNFGDRLLIDLAAAVNAPGDVTALFTITDISNPEFLICDRDGDEVFVARPWTLRESSAFPSGYDYTYTDANERTASDGTSTETQQITPSYEVGEQIIAIRVITRINHDVGEDEVPIKWVDVNTAGRAWAAS